MLFAQCFLGLAPSKVNGSSASGWFLRGIAARESKQLTATDDYYRLISIRNL
jgi:hypothetical protein